MCVPSSVRYTYIADGHHRSASAFRVGEMKIKAAIAEGHNVSGDEPFCYFLAVLFPANQYVPLHNNHDGLPDVHVDTSHLKQNTMDWRTGMWMWAE